MLKEPENHGSWPTVFSWAFARRRSFGLKSQWRPVLFRTFLLKTIKAVSFQSLQKICGYFVDAMQALCVLAQFFGGDPQEYLPLHTLKMLLHEQLEFIPEFR